MSLLLLKITNYKKNVIKIIIGSFFYVYILFGAFSAYADVAYDAWRLTSKLEEQNDIPPGLLHAMSLVETGSDKDGFILPWPYILSVNSGISRYISSAEEMLLSLDKLKSIGFSNVYVDKTKKTIASAKESIKKISYPVKIKGSTFSKKFKSPEAAAEFAKKLLKYGENNFDAGLMQINWKYHSENFKSIEEVFDPKLNLTYAIKYLKKNFDGKDWWTNVGNYHSFTKKLADNYTARVWHMYKKILRLDEK